MIESDPLSPSPTRARTYRTRTTAASLQRCSVWVQQLPDESISINRQQVPHPFLNCKDSEISQDEFSESSDISQPPKKKFCISSPTIPQDDTEVDTSVASDAPSRPSKRKEIRSQSITLKPICGWKGCNFDTTDLIAYVSHVSSHLPNIDIKICEGTEDEEVYLCLWELCDFETPNADEVTRHVNFHSYHTKMKCLGSVLCSELKLPDCHYGTDGVNLVPDLPTIFECCWDDCRYTCNNPNSFFAHVQVHASESDSSARNKDLVFSCLWRGCKTEVRKKNRLAEHVRVHSKEKVVACPTCGSLFASRTKLVDHRKRQSLDDWNSYQCSHCSRFYPSERLLRDHMRHHVNRYKCQFCDMTCPSPWTLSNHIRYRHIDERPFQCEYCSYRSKTQFNMRRHMISHSSSVNFSCEDCDFTCRSHFTLNWHYRKVHEIPPIYCCHMCDQRFSRGAYLTTHLMKNHNFRWPSGHSRFRYKHDEDGLFKLQTVRYESWDVVEDINRGDGEERSVLKSSDKFSIRTKLSSDGVFGAKVVIDQKFGEDDDPDDPDECNSLSSSGKETPKENSDTKYSCGPSMPLLDAESSPPSSRKVLISIDEVDCSGNVIRSSTMEADELDNVDQSAQFVLDGDRLL